MPVPEPFVPQPDDDAETLNRILFDVVLKLRWLSALGSTDPNLVLSDDDGNVLTDDDGQILFGDA